MFDRIFRNWKTTIFALVIVVGITVLIAMGRVDFDQINDLVLIFLSGGAAGVLAFSKDKKKVEPK